jgi:nucleoside-diphosphate-sugar epimerase
MNEIAITGSTGVIGRRAVREVLAASHRVRGVTTTALTAERNARELFDDATVVPRATREHPAERSQHQPVARRGPRPAHLPPQDR